MGATTGDAQSGLDALLAFVFMSPDREEKTQMLLDRCGLDALFKVRAGAPHREPAVRPHT